MLGSALLLLGGEHVTQGAFLFSLFSRLLTLGRRVRALNSSDNAAGSGCGLGFAQRT